MNNGTANHKPLYTVIAIVAAAGAVFGYRAFVMNTSMPEGLILANGRIEGDTLVVAAKIPGRISSVHAGEGDAVDNGKVLAEMDDSQVRAKTEQARAALAAALAGRDAARAALDLLIKETEIQNEKAEAAVANARAVLAKARAQELQAGKDARRFKELADDGSIGRQKAEQAALAYEASKNDRKSAESGVRLVEKQRDDARLGSRRIAAKTAETRSISARAEQAAAAVNEAESVLSDLTVKAPGKGVVTAKIISPGEVIGAGSPLFTLVDLDGLYLKVFVPEKDIGRLKLGQKARIHLDSMKEKPFGGTVKTIASRAEFTPKEVQTPDERVKLVYAVKIYLDENPGHAVTPGIPADAVIRVDENTPWTEPRW
jgi:HlyD family secretion protein